MSTRAIGVIVLTLVTLPLMFFGLEQYGFAFLGLLSGLGAFARMIGAQSPIWMILFPMLTIVLMILFSASAITAIGYSVVQIADCPQTFIQHRPARYIPVGFAFGVIVGLTLLSLFPAEPPIVVSSALFLFPSALLSVSSIYALQKT